MKTRFNTFDIVCSVTELQRLIGMRVNNVYDIDSKTYLIKFQRTDEKAVLLLESGNRFHTTAFEWPKNVAPSGFSMKMRKHLKNKRLESFRQLGTDRIVDLQFGTNEAAYHIIIELYDRGNMILTDHELTILYVLRPHVEGEEVRFAVREKYPVNRARTKGVPTNEELERILRAAKPGELLRKVLTPHLEYGPPLIEHVLIEAGLDAGCKISKEDPANGELVETISRALRDADLAMENARTRVSKGYVIQRREERPRAAGGEGDYYSNQEFHPALFAQHAAMPHREHPSFDAAVDEYFSSLESQRIDLKAIQQEREALKKLDNVRKDHDQRLVALERTQEEDTLKGEMISRNQELVDNAILAVRTALANQMSWPDIEALVKDARSQGDPVAAHIRRLKLETNHMTLQLSDPYDSDDGGGGGGKSEPLLVDVDLALSAFANARRYYDQKRSAARKQQKTIESHGKALKSAEKKTKQTLKEMQTLTSISKARRVYWFEKFYWFVSSENYLVIGGRDQQQNELIVKRYMRPGDVYVHADVHGASSVVVRNPGWQQQPPQPVPPKTLNEAGTMAISYSVAWEARVVTSAWWVHATQVSKTAPTGEYLTTGSFVVRGKKNYLPPCHLVMGLGILFRLEDGSVERHRDERAVRSVDDDDGVGSGSVVPDDDDHVEIEVPDGSDHDEEDEPVKKDEAVAEDDDDDEDGADGGAPRFPDTHIKLQHFAGTKINLLAEPVISLDDDADAAADESETVIYLGDDKPVVLKPSAGGGGGGRRSRQSSESTVKQQPKPTAEEKTKTSDKEMKRGQRGKLKKIKEKYKDQDDEERQLRMEILQSAGKGRDGKRSRKGGGGKGQDAELREQQQQQQQRRKNAAATKPKAPVIIAAVEDNDDADEETQQQQQQQADAEADMLDALTGVPVAEDELLFAVPVVAPYNTLNNYKFKVKLTPGTSRRGKAARAAVAMFVRDRAASQRERDLMKGVKDEALARNVPGKVKMSAPKLQQQQKK